jgi:tripartite motif-containing protein 2/3
MTEHLQNLSQMLDARRRELIETVRRTRDDKRKVLQEQLGIIQAEKAKVEQICSGLQHQVSRDCCLKYTDLI